MARITLDWIKGQVVHSQCYQFPGTLMIVCCLTLKNGFNTVGQAACADAEIFNKLMGEKLAYEDALNKVWVLEGYRLKQKIAYNKDISEYPV